MRLKKLLLISLLVVITFLFCGIKFSAALPESCGCAPTYMGAHLVEFYCEAVGGEMTYRECHYVY
jgi:hypothetical protein